MILVVLALVSGLSFLHYGREVLSESRLEEEFSRYGLSDVRRLVGVLEVLGGVGVIAGLFVAPLGALAALGLAVLMLLGVAIRIRLPRRASPDGARRAALRAERSTRGPVRQFVTTGAGAGRLPLRTADVVARVNTDNAGRYCLIRSPALMCMPIAPSMNAARPIEAGRTS